MVSLAYKSFIVQVCATGFIVVQVYATGFIVQVCATGFIVVQVYVTSFIVHRYTLLVLVS